MTGDPFASPNPHRLFRDPGRGRVFGVCAGIADYFGIEPFLVRLGTVVGALFFFMPVVAGYLVLAVLLKPKPAQVYASRDEEAFWRSLAIKPDRTAAGLHQRFRELERRLGAIETCVTSKEFELTRAINDLER